jgi:hypothetical protein
MALLNRFTVAILVAAAVAWGGAVDVATSAPTEAQVRAGYLYNFAMFVEWPAAQAQEPLTIAVLGDDFFAFALRQINGRLANGRKIVVKNVDESDDLARTSILYIASADDRAAAAALSRVARSPVLTVGESPRFTQIGGIVRLYTDESRLRFEINVSRSQQTDLRISSKLLGLAKIVKEPK